MAVHKMYQWQHLQAIVWKIENDLDLEEWSNKLSAADAERYKKLKNTKKQIEFLCTRAALAHLTGGNIDLSYSERGAPQLKGYRGVSISHNPQFAAVIVSKEYKVGIDLEAFRPQMLKLGPRYLSDQELHSLKTENEKEMTLAYWSAKETLIKIEDDPGLDLRREMRISPFPYRHTGMSQGLVLKDKQLRRYPLFFKFDPDYCLCFSYQN